MQILSGSKREITLKLWKEQIQKYIGKIQEHGDCFNLYGDIDPLDWIIEDCEKLKNTVLNAKEVIAFMNENNIT